MKIELKEEVFELINFIDLTLNEQKMVLVWRNHESVKKWMHDSQNITTKNHLKFIASLKMSKTKEYMVVKKNTDYIGVVDFTDINFAKKSADIGLYANPIDKIKGAGSMLLEVGLKYAFEVLKLKTLNLEVFIDNERAIGLYRKFNFKDSGKKVADGKSIICMKFRNEEE
ncbi:UDP-4-amino-4,6-dideoxy-N-acetyl-beta-L-altrosamine N-acetyltransferase [Sulfurimonas sp.]|uniref:UDP-4-amino-4, 6-dideoxy-N-acetyl-beta-L-altrosamine N-acetyltransferase n=1 Tax=Sulfurimonas sp. TaxID=2022749 RepID=UPI0025DD9CD9|nr:UDP-4-amino-4,6-dideoxy-N-acetyl-beta-L-altrosamine N-acetyltransferase [Sulfurimonas sp.]MDD5157856.1 UDP-4-amino-4,6-dideoxy-N-acetyl-beta-L-altrosamine N-acetyltransferase [Sulfurimonas sp.]